MFSLLKKPAGAAGVVFAAGLLMVAPNGFAQQLQPRQSQPRMAEPGTVNYVEGQVQLDGQALSPANVGAAVVAPDHQLTTTNGKAEMLLTPGVFFRLGPNSTVRMISPSITNTHVQLVQGHGMMEVAQYLKENHIQVDVAGAAATIDRAGIYEFDGNPAIARVYDGKVTVEMNGRTDNIYKGDQVALEPDNAKLKTRDFDLKKTEAANDLYNWSKLRADYTAQANMSAAEMYGPGYGQGWYGAGWYWDPYFSQYAFLLSDGFLWDPFGYGFFSPGYWGMYGGYLGGGYGYYGRGLYGRPSGAIVRGSAAGNVVGSGFSGGSGAHGAIAGGGGFRGGFGGSGGFHGGGFGGGGRR